MIKWTPRVFLLVVFLSWATVFGTAQSSADHATPAQPPGDQQAELSSHDEPTTFKVNVKLVLVRVVVRDAKGQVVGNLHKEDFQLFDKGKPQVISEFEVEHAPVPNAKPQEAAATPDNDPMHKLGAMPDRYVAYVFDDEHVELANLSSVREAARRHFQTLQPNDRAAIFTTSGKIVMDFTDDRAKLNDALSRVTPIAQLANEIDQCPSINHYMADLIVNKNDPEALNTVEQEYLECTQNQVQLPKELYPTAPDNYSTMGTSTPGAPVPNAIRVVAQRIKALAQSELRKDDQSSQEALLELKRILKRVSVMPGQRSIILVSPGFLAPEMQHDVDDIVDQAVRSQIVINSIDARGLYVVIPGGDVTKRGTVSQDPSTMRSQYESEAALEQGNTLSLFAEQTGGVYIHNNNDFDDALRRASGAAEYSYLLGFSPQNVKPDGTFHTLKVTLKDQGKLSIQARRGYFAPAKDSNPVEEAKREMLDEVFSQEELHELPVELHTQFFKASDDQARVTVLAHVDVKQLRFRKVDGRNDNVLTCDSALFNQNGNYVQGMQKVVTLRLKDDTLEHRLPSGITLKTSFDVKPGNYMVRLVVRDAEGQLMSAETGAVEIP